MSNENQVVKENRAAVCQRILDLQKRVFNFRAQAANFEDEANELVRQLRHASAEDIVFNGSVYNLAFSGSGPRMRKIRTIEVIR